MNARRALVRFGVELVRELAFEAARTAGASLAERLVPRKDPPAKKDDDQP